MSFRIHLAVPKIAVHDFLVKNFQPKRLHAASRGLLRGGDSVEPLT